MRKIIKNMFKLDNIENRDRSLHKFIIFIVAFVTALFLTGCRAASVGEPEGTQTPQSRATILLESGTTQAGALVRVRGAEWPADENVFINLETTEAGSPLSRVVAIAGTDSLGTFDITFTYPRDDPWSSATQVSLVAMAGDDAATAALAVDKVKIFIPVNPVSLAPTVVPTAAASYAGTGTVTGDFVNLRSGPSTAYPVLFVAKSGDEFNVIGQSESGQWLKVRVGSGLEGWMSRSFTNFLATAPTVVAPPLPTLPTVIANWRGEYYSNSELAGAPVLVRNDQNVNFGWGFASPAGSIPADNFSVRWTRSLYLPAGLYRFSASADDGVRVWMDGDLLINEWREQSPTVHVAERTLTQSGDHQFRIEYFDRTELAEISFWWERIDSFPQWRGAYFSNPNLTGDPVLERNEVDIDFDWGSGSPGSGVPSDNFSSRWSRTVQFDAGLYRFHARMDDGLRLFVDGNLLIDAWQDGGVREIVRDYSLNSGSHAIRVEYYERSGAALAQVWWERIQPAASYPDWKGEYWSNTNLQGRPALVRNDPAVSFNWMVDGPTGLGVFDNFSARWTKTVQFDTATYRFVADADDGIRMWIDGQLILDDWQDGGAGIVAVERSLASGPHEVRIEYYERQGLASVRVWWEKVTPQAAYPNWRGEYWPNRDLSGSPVLVRDDVNVDFRWSDRAPDDSLPRDRFSARWTRTIRFEPSIYRFFVRADDGVRLYVDNERIIDQWHDSNSEVYVADVQLGGDHQIKVEYYENRGGARIELWWQRLAPTPTQTPIDQPTATETATPLATPTATSTPLPTDTPVAAPTDTPTVPPTLPATETPVPAPTETPTATATAEPITLCPEATPEPLLVEPVDDKTDELSQIITVFLGGGEAVTVTSESGVFAVSGAFDAVANPAQVEIALLPDTEHHLTVEGKVRTVEVNGCTYGGYTLSTQVDRNGQPLVIQQE